VGTHNLSAYRRHLRSEPGRAGATGWLAQPVVSSRYTWLPVYAVIKTGGKQERVEEGQTLAVELLGATEGDEVTFDPVLVVDGETVLARRQELAASTVSARVIGTAKGPKVRGFTYKPKTRARRSWGHRQRYTTIEITGINRGDGRREA
jgi:large subunit ribosomal protein L21